jgi:uncharacterized protein
MSFISSQQKVSNEIAQLPAFHIMTKVTGSKCNLNCKYCYYLSKENLYHDSSFMMSDDLLESFTQQYILSQNLPEITFAWQGGEPTLAGINFFTKALKFQKKFSKPGMRIFNTIQTNGTLINDEWGKFFHENQFLVGISLDGPRRLHDVYRLDKAGKPTFDRVIKGLEILKKYNVEYNILACVHSANEDYPLEVYQFFRDRLQAKYIQFIPIVERKNNTGFQEGNKVTSRSINAKKYGEFLIAIFDEWIQKDVGDIFIQIFDVALGAWLHKPGSLCIFAPTCGTAMALEHNGDMYCCDHFVEPRFYLGNIKNENISTLANSDKQTAFGKSKLIDLPKDCINCNYRFACHGGCIKNRFIQDSHGEMGLNYLCDGYKSFFTHIDRPMQIMANLIRMNRPASDIMHLSNHLHQEHKSKSKQRHNR